MPIYCKVVLRDSKRRSFGNTNLLFYEVQNTNFCPNCKYIDCVPYTSEICKNVEANVIV